MLQMEDAPEDHEAYAMLDDAEEGARWDAAGQNAVNAAYTMLRNKGIGHVYRRLPDGTEELLNTSDE